MKHLVVLLLALLLIQPMLDSFDVADYNGAINQASSLLIQQSELDAHCIKNDDHNTHQVEHLQLANALADALEDSHCHVCHVSALYSHLWHYSVSAIENESISLTDPRFNSRLVIPDLRPPISSLIS